MASPLALVNDKDVETEEEGEVMFAAGPERKERSDMEKLIATVTTLATTLTSRQADLERDLVEMRKDAERRDREAERRQRESEERQTDLLSTVMYRLDGRQGTAQRDLESAAIDSNPFRQSPEDLRPRSAPSSVVTTSRERGWSDQPICPGLAPGGSGSRARFMAAEGESPLVFHTYLLCFR